MQIRGTIFKIQRFSLHDGPGIRTIVFLKGCPLGCLWCANPESQDPSPQISFYKSKCIHCGKCITLCPEGAIIPEEEGKIKWEVCTGCGKCAEGCFAGALTLIGQYMTVEEVVEKVKKDSSFYSDSGGGITLSGGEPTLQAEFARALLKECKRCGFHTGIETCGYVKWPNLKKILEYTDLVLYDLKIMDSNKHKNYISLSNNLILANIKKVASEGIPMIIRVPIIPGYTDSEENIKAICEFAMELETAKELHLLPYHGYGEAKYVRLGMKYRLKGLQAPTKGRIQGLKEIVESCGLKAKIYG